MNLIIPGPSEVRPAYSIIQDNVNIHVIGKVWTIAYSFKMVITQSEPA